MTLVFDFCYLKFSCVLDFVFFVFVFISRMCRWLWPLDWLIKKCVDMTHNST